MMTKTAIVALTVTGLFSIAVAKQPASFDEAKRIAAEHRQPVLLEFVVEACKDCESAKFAAESDPDLKATLATLVHLTVDAESEAGRRLVESYGLARHFPAYVLTDATGGEIARWTDFLAPPRFMRTLGRARSDLTTIEDRVSRFKSDPNLNDAVYLGGYFLSLRQPTKAADYYREAERLHQNPRRDYTFDIFFATATAVWNGEATFDEAVRTGETAIKSPQQGRINTHRVTANIGRLARKTGHTDQLVPFLQAALDATEAPHDGASRRRRDGFKADLELYANHDTTKAIEIQRAGVERAGTDDPSIRVTFAEWCTERKINLKEAEGILRGALADAANERVKARRLYLLAEIAFAGGEIDQAVSLGEEALTLEPFNPLYSERVAEYKERQ